METQFSIGAVLGTGLKIWFKNLPAFLLITALIYSPLLIWGVTIVQGEPELMTYVAQL